MNGATWLDIAVVIIFGLSTLLGLLRGVIKEVTALLVWLAAYAAAKQFYEPAGEMFANSLHDPVMRHVAGFAAVFIGTVIAVSLVRLVFTHLSDLMGLGLLDRLCGGAFGVTRALIIVIAATLVAGLTDVPRQTWWKDALLAPMLERGALQAEPWLPPEIYARLQYRDKHGKKMGVKDTGKFM